MARSVNKVILLGNVGKDPEIRSTPSGTMVASFSLATSDRYKDAQGNWQDRTEWHNLVAFKRTAEIVRDYVKKGSKLYIEGSLRPATGTTRRPDRSSTGPRSSSMSLSLLSGREEGSGGYSRLQLQAVQRPALTSARPPARTMWPNPPKSPTTTFPSKYGKRNNPQAK